MTSQEIITIASVATALISAVSTIFAWIAKIRWSKEFERAKNETIAAKEAEIRSLQLAIGNLEKVKDEHIAGLNSAIQRLESLNPKSFDEHLAYIRKNLEGFIETLQKDLAIRTDEVENLFKEGKIQKTALTEKEAEMEQLRLEVTNLEYQLKSAGRHEKSLSLQFTDGKFSESFKVSSIDGHTAYQRWIRKLADTISNYNELTSESSFHEIVNHANMSPLDVMLKDIRDLKQSRTWTIDVINSQSHGNDSK